MATPVEKHFHSNDKDYSEQQVQVQVWNPKSGAWEGPARLLTWGRGYACVVSGSETHWIPVKWVRQLLRRVEDSKLRKPEEPDDPQLQLGEKGTRSPDVNPADAE